MNKCEENSVKKGKDQYAYGEPASAAKDSNMSDMTFENVEFDNPNLGLSELENLDSESYGIEVYDMEDIKTLFPEYTIEAIEGFRSDPQVEPRY